MYRLETRSTSVNTVSPVLAVGTVANENLRNLGHLVLKFNGLSEAEMQGDVNVPEGAIPEIVPGTEIQITGVTQ